jgi:Lrp/AsnC family leucine-responsive transcriptional regulator
MKHKIDEVDKSILRLLQQDGNMPLKQIASKINKSVATICERIKRLSNQGVIIGHRAMINREMLDLDIMGFITLNLDDNSELEMQRFTIAVLKIPGVCECLRVSGKVNTLIKVITANVSDLSIILTKVSNLDNVSGAGFLLVVGDMIPDKGINF